MSFGLIKEDKREEVKGMLAELRRTIKGSAVEDLLVMTDTMLNSLDSPEEKLDAEFAFMGLAGAMFLEEMGDKVMRFADSQDRRNPDSAMKFVRVLQVSMKVKVLVEAMHQCVKDDARREAEEAVRVMDAQKDMEIEIGIMGMPHPPFGGFPSSGMDGMGKLGRR